MKLSLLPISWVWSWSFKKYQFNDQPSGMKYGYQGRSTINLAGDKSYFPNFDRYNQGYLTAPKNGAARTRSFLGRGVV